MSYQPATNSPTDDSASNTETTVLVRGETVNSRDTKAQASNSQSNDEPSPDNKTQATDKAKDAPKQISEAKLQLQSHLPALEDEADIGVQKNQVVVRDGEADLAFLGTLLAAAAPNSAPKGKWQEYRIYLTSAGKHVFSMVSRSIYADEEDSYKAEIFDPSPSSVSSKLLRSARDLTSTRPMEWTDAAVSFFGYDPLAKVLYRKVGGQFEEKIT